MHDAGGDVAVIGAGLIGLSIAFELAQRGATVRVYDRAEPGRGASWAAAGMLAPRTEAMPDDAMAQLCETSLAMYPHFVEQLRGVADLDPQLRLDGILSVACDEEQYRALAHRAADLKARGFTAELLDRTQTVVAEPVMGKDVRGALLVHGEGQVDNRRLGRLLLRACETSRVLLRTGVRQVEIECDARRVLGVRTELGFTPARYVVNATGAWAAELAGVPVACVPPVIPVKGEMLSIEMPRGLMRRTTWVPGAYLVPRSDGRVLVGATVEHCAFEARTTASGIHQLLHNALAAAPALGGFTIGETWAGLRPGTPDERPFLGETPLDGYLLATGHYRNGVLLAPVTARLLADAVAGERSELAPFSLARTGTVIARA